jgi:LemA protein
MTWTVWLILAIAAVLIFAIAGLYNSLITGKNRVEEALSDMDVQLKRRYDLIPNLVETVKGYAAHEEGTLAKVIAARNSAMEVPSTEPSKKIAVENQLSSTLRSIFALAENYPDLKANQNFLELQRELTDTEDKIMASRRFYNGNVRDFNTKLQVFPTNLINKMLKFTAYSFYEIGDAVQKENITVKF